jgi:glycosyltransferase involved in cell wall biosynthesis
VRLHGFEVSSQTLSNLLGRNWVKKIYAFPHQLKLVNSVDSRIRGVNAAFNTTIFRPHTSKDRKLIVRTAAGLPSKDLPLLFKLAKMLPGYRFVLAIVTCNDRESYIDELRNLHRSMASNVELMVDVPNEDLAVIVAEAGIYFHTAERPGLENATPVGMPVSIAEAMATGAYIVAADLKEFQDYIGDAGATYRDLADAARLIAETTRWSDTRWHDAWKRSVERAFQYHADSLVLQVMLDDWSTLAASNGGGRDIDTLGQQAN